MNSSFINRLVGTSIVVIAAIVFIPNILDGEKVHYKEGFKAIPERSEFKTIDLQQEIDENVAGADSLQQDEIEDIQADDIAFEQQANIAQSDYTSEAKVVEAVIAPKAQPQAAAPVQSIKPRQNNENLTSMAYVIQLGSFSHAANVKALQAKLQAKGFKTFTKPVKTPNGTLTKVFVGPSLNKNELQKQLPALKELTKLNGKITQFEVTK
ncbi:MULTISPECIES: SPOR domain-containing protein [unclassified Pseudoalteromonas]|uniref:SPOR domain-containing protein n=1 Tax=unclassified Pseudoalteromonas TaxID=194690 RepID=UPI0015CCA9D2|nr:MULTISPECIES: SPOR domain-containing protein [unclassified Pseudoalteromonas]MBB1370279.1 SPOR domain-containing protein [Pseudoalteromonas sp. SR45-4]MBB1406338.1 SPOR domain-containing protein [Pseudoalteromonas sp. SG44-5]NYR13683.1 SPOR domain-containing protein [Pseudoalteromonas sp. MIP2626]